MPNHNFATFVRTQRRQRNMLQKEVAYRARISERTLRDWEKGKASPGRWELESLLTALELTPQERLQALSLVPTLRGVQISKQEFPEAVREELGPMPALGDLLHAMRLRRRVSQEQLAEILKVAPSTVFRWETTRTLPSEENMQRLCTILEASPEERRTLFSRRMQDGVDTQDLSLDACIRQVDLLDRQLANPAEACFDLQALVLKRRLWILAQESEQAVRQLARLQTHHASWLWIQGRAAEAEICAHRSLQALKGRKATEAFWRATLNLVALFAKNRGNTVAAVDLLAQWCPAVPEAEQATVWCDMALHAIFAEQYLEGNRYLAIARKTMPLSANAEGLFTYYMPSTECAILCRLGRWAEALERLPPLPDQNAPSGPRAFYLILWAEILFGAGERDEAQRLMDHLSLVLQEYPQPNIARRLENLGARL